MIYSMRFISEVKPPVLRKETVTKAIIDAIRRFVREHRMTLYAYCLMPDHLHIVAAPQGGSSIGKLMQDFKVATGLADCDSGNYESIWSRVLYLPIRDDAMLKDICLFVASNPIRKGLVSDLKQWPHIWVKKSLVTK
ncbi:MAG: transposase [Pseudomonadota bacterium]